jgi:tetratricopeptide (TPR) repeat protein
MDTISPTDWDKDVQLDAAETYDALVRSLGRNEGFGIFLVRCVEGERERLIQRLQKDLPSQQMAQLKLEAALEDGNLYNRVAAELQAQPDLDVLFIDGLEKSFEAYIKPGYGGQGDYYKLDSVPRVLGHLNLQRERLRNDFPVSLVIFLSVYGLKYMARRSPDFFDWRSGIFEFVADREIVEILSSQMVGDYQEYLQWTHAQRLDRIREIQALLGEENQTAVRRATLAFNQGNIFIADQSCEAAIESYDEALKYKPDDSATWSLRGISLDNLGNYEAAIASYDKALKHKPDDYFTWYFRGNSLNSLGYYEAAIASYDEALKYKPDEYVTWHRRGDSLGNSGHYKAAIDSYDQALRYKPDYDTAWFFRGNCLDNLSRYEAAIESYDQALKYNPDDYATWFFRGNSLEKLARYEAAIESYDQALKYNPDDYITWFLRGNSLEKLARYEAAIESYDRVLKYKPDEYATWFLRGNCLGSLGRYEAAIESYDQALKHKPDYHLAWFIRGKSLDELGRYKAAIESYDQALKHKPDYHLAWYCRACTQSLSQNPEAAFQDFGEAIRLAPKEIRKLAKTDSDFDGMRDDPRFQALLEAEPPDIPHLSPPALRS